MATPAAEVTYSANQIEQFLKCPVCLDRYNNPKILPCQHTFCKSPCLEGLCNFRSRKIKCPECRAEHFVPHSGPDGFPNNLTIANFLDLPQQAHTPRPVEEEANNVGSTSKCGICEKDGVTSKCLHCEKYVCESCRRSHFGQMKMDIGRLVNQIRRGIPKLSNSIGDVEKKSESVKQHVEGVKSEVKNTIERYIKELKDRQTLLNSELDTFLQGELRQLRLQQENMEVELASISSYCDSTESTLNNKTSPVPEGDLINAKKQCVEYMEQIRGSENEDNHIETKQVKFTFEGQPLQQSINDFGELLVNAPGTSTARSETSRGSSRGSNNSNLNQRRWTNPQPLHSIYYGEYNGTANPDPPRRVSSDVSVRPETPSRRPQTPPTRRFNSSRSFPAQRTQHAQRMQRASTEMDYIFGRYDTAVSNTVPTPRSSITPRTSNYMYDFRESGSDNIAEEMEHLIQSMERNQVRGTNRLRGNARNASSVLWNRSQEERVGGLMGGGGGSAVGAANTIASPYTRPRVPVHSPESIPIVGGGGGTNVGAANTIASPYTRPRVPVQPPESFTVSFDEETRPVNPRPNRPRLSHNRTNNGNAQQSPSTNRTRNGNVNELTNTSTSQQTQRTQEPSPSENEARNPSNQANSNNSRPQRQERPGTTVITRPRATEHPHINTEPGDTSTAQQEQQNSSNQSSGNSGNENNANASRVNNTIPATSSNAETGPVAARQSNTNPDSSTTSNNVSPRIIGESSIFVMPIDGRQSRNSPERRPQQKQKKNEQAAARSETSSDRAPSMANNASSTERSPAIASTSTGGSTSQRKSTPTRVIVMGQSQPKKARKQWNKPQNNQTVEGNSGPQQQSPSNSKGPEVKRPKPKEGTTINPKRIKQTQKQGQSSTGKQSGPREPGSAPQNPTPSTREPVASTSTAGLPEPINGSFARSGTFVRDEGPSQNNTRLPVVATENSVRFDVKL